jgi:hypothetical protein
LDRGRAPAGEHAQPMVICAREDRRGRPFSTVRPNAEPNDAASTPSHEQRGPRHGSRALFRCWPGQRSEGTLAAVRMEIAPPRPVAVVDAYGEHIAPESNHHVTGGRATNGRATR